MSPLSIRSLAVSLAGIALVASACTTGASPSGSITPSSTTAAPVESATSPPDSPEPSLAVASCDCPCASPSAATYPGVVVARVSLNGDDFFSRATSELDIRRGKGLEVEPATVTDGRFLDRFQQWDEGAVWWELGPDADPDASWVQIDLDGAFTVDSAIVQADNNDSYKLSYRNLETGAWETLWIVPPDYAFGMVTRPNPLDDTERYEFPEPVTTDALRLEAMEGDEMGDGMYAVSEIQVFGARTSS